MIPRSKIIRDVVITLVVVTGTLLAFYIGMAYGSRTQAQAFVEVYERGKKDALRMSPRPSMDLEMACIAIWANKVPVPEALK
jgi:hypothetical protein